MSSIQRSYTFADGTTPTWSQVENEIAVLYDTWNNHDAGNKAWTNFVLKASDSRYFKISIGYLSDGVTPTLVYQEITYP